MIDRASYILTASALLFSFILFFLQTGDLIGSFAAALLAAGLVWISYIMIRLTVLALRK